MPGPAPYDIDIDSVGYKIALDERGRLRFALRPGAFFATRISQGAASQASFPPDRRLPYSFGVFSGGYGQARLTTNEETNRYWYADSNDGSTTDRGVDASLGDRVILGPRISRLTLPGGFVPTAGYFFQLATALYLAATDGTDTKVFKFNTSTIAYDLTATIASRVVTDAIVYRGTQTADYAYLALGSGAAMKYSTDAVTWTDVGGTAFRAEKLTAIDNELWRFISSSASSDVSKCTDGGTAPTFAGTATAGTITIGDYSGTCTGLYTHGDRVVIGKTTGLFVLASDRATLNQNLDADLQRTPDTAAFVGGTVWRGQLVTPYGLTLRAYTADFAVTIIGWDDGLENDSLVYGRPHAITADQYHLWSVARSGHLMKGVVTHGTAGAIESVNWHPVSYLGTTDRGLTTWGGVTPELHIVLSGGVVARVIMANTGNPLTYSAYRYCPAGAIYWPRFYGGYTTVTKWWFSFQPDCDALSAGQTLQFGYKLAADSSYTNITGAQTISPGQRDNLPTPMASRALTLRAILTTDDATLTPQLRSATIEFLAQPDPVPTIDVWIDCTQGAALLDGSGQIMEPSTAADRLFDLVTAGKITTLDPWGRSLDVTVPLDGVEEVAGAPHSDGREPDLLVHLTMQGQTPRARGTFSRLELYTFDQLKVETFAQLLEL